MSHNGAAAVLYFIFLYFAGVCVPLSQLCSTAPATPLALDERQPICCCRVIMLNVFVAVLTDGLSNADEEDDDDEDEEAEAEAAEEEDGDELEVRC